MSNARNLSNLLGTGTTIATASIADDAITSAKIADDAVITAAIADDAVTADHIATGAVQGVDVGTVAAFAMASAPTGWLAADGSAVSRTTYSGLFAVIGTTWGTGNGSTTFNVPDLRGAFVRGSGSHGSSSDAGGTAFGGQSVGNYQNDQMQKITGRVAHGQGNSGAGLIKRTSNTGAFTMNLISQSLLIQSVSYTTNYMNYSDFDSADSTNSRASSSTGGETRPFNAAMLFCIKT